ncbi:hypothetical protein VCRA2113O324_40222 [Vibrio crassostreae]|nr:hypothetical protein EDB58_101213 [Vibrio crassostreae]ROO69461.1 hypothetical protein EDB57_3131 [Vibrio crassostreae]RPF53636.1 hypothetical protein EDB61_1105 [Vibrio crassostreae]CAK2135661.1 hypothetical protein VCRA2113O324_40222 [Vibrio crassostreae]CAK2158692.1 hypothetical protein VCRA2111O320_40221 [Vibrio crassostreae]
MEPSKYKYPITAKLIRDARLRSGLQQKDFNSQNNLEITQATFSRWETSFMCAGIFIRYLRFSYPLLLILLHSLYPVDVPFQSRNRAKA